MFKNLLTNFDFLNLVIALLALLLALYSIYYTHRFNRRKIVIGSGVFHSDEMDPPIAWFTIHNTSPVSITVADIAFLNSKGEDISPLLTHEPTQIPMYIIPDYKYAEPLDSPQVIQPYNSLDLGYYFDSVYRTMTIKVTCLEHIRLFRKSKSFVTMFSDIPD
ncbi:MAG TPA: hypothetical protein DIW07_10875 [Lachnospiraceae bacterium]|jgi:hypothetical protein|uniref:Uncharacterized protein n=1 Tax=Muricomes intestini TaxID=1796634 RepID=A0A4R3K6P1_9FIRM|nr:hypothetical protein [Muricomes intestini]TCS78499.1 hypothetical protein EDD59_11124 [Muricomes intestini]HCR83895.1 hypothetical protein [Lachnospiraceae bacterium]